MTHTTVGGHKLDHLALNSATAVAAEARVNPALPSTAVVEFVSAHGTYLLGTGGIGAGKIKLGQKYFKKGSHITCQ